MKLWKIPLTPSANSILVIGDVIEDIYIQGQVVGIANEDPVAKFRPNLKNRIIYGGAQFVADSIYKFTNAKVGLFPTTESSIIRHIDERYNRNVFTVDNIPRTKLWTIDELLPVLEEKPKVIVVWDDNRSPGAMGIVQEALHIAMLENVLLHSTIIIVDSPNSQWNHPMTNYWKMNSEEYQGLPPQLLQTDTIITSSNKVIYYCKRKAIPFSVPTCSEPVDTIGAGDVFLSVFSSLVSESVDINTAINEAIVYSAESVRYHGCYMPSRGVL